METVPIVLTLSRIKAGPCQVTLSVYMETIPIVLTSNCIKAGTLSGHFGLFSWRQFKLS
jgi:hypothetical protein